MNQSQNSAFKPVIHHHNHHHTELPSKNLLISSSSLSSSSSSSASSCSSTSSTSSVKSKSNEYLNIRTAKYNHHQKLKQDNNQGLGELNQQSLSVTVNESNGTASITNSDPQSSSNNNSTMSSAVAAAAALAASQLNPFYIDKIFNFQNMFLFSGANNSNNNSNTNPTPNTPSPFNSNTSDSNLKCLNDTILNSVSNTAAKLAAMNHSSELHALFQQNLLHNVYNYYNSNSNNSNSIPPLAPSTSSTFLNNSSLFLKQEMMPINVNTNIKSSHQQQQGSSAKKSKNNFSIERILSLPSQSSNQSWTKIENKNKSTNNINQKFNQFIPNSNNLVKHLGKTPIALTAPLPPQLAALYQSSNHHSLASSSSHSSQSSSQQHQKSIKSTTDQVAQTSQQQQQPVYKSKNAKKYKCDLCGRGFSRSNTLITHRVSYRLVLFLFLI
jgi:hypothetical protein